MTDRIKNIKSEFPIFKNRDMVYLDNGATSQRPICVLNVIHNFYEYDNANPMRGLYRLSLDATEHFDRARKNVAKFINAAEPEEVIFTRNATESLNLVAYSYARSILSPGDEIIVSIAEHHSNFLPWKNAAEEKGAKIVFLPCEQDGEFKEETLKSLITEKTKILAITQVSNIFGRVNDIKGFAKIMHEAGAVIAVDGAQSVPHMKIDVRDLDVDFLAFSGHKMYAPMGIGVLYGKREHLEKMPPFLYGGEMIEYVFTDRVKYAEVPHKFEAGTVNAAGAVGLEAAVDFMECVGIDEIQKREDELTRLMFDEMKKIPHVNIIGADNAEDHHGILTFTVDDVHPHDVSEIFSANNICIRAGHHCAQPLHKHLGLFSTSRASLGFYNDEEDVMRFIEVLKTIRSKMGYGQ